MAEDSNAQLPAKLTQQGDQVNEKFPPSGF